MDFKTNEIWEGAREKGIRMDHKNRLLSDFKIKAILESARELIGDKRKWCKGLGALDADGELCDAASARARSWCALGAVKATLGIDFGTDYGMDACMLAAHILDKHTPEGSILEFNDNETVEHSNVITVFDGAIESLDVIERGMNNGK